MLYVFVFSLAMNMITEALITAALIPFQFFLYYLSRYKQRTTLSFNLYCAVIHLFFAASYRISAGISGSTLLSFSIVYFLCLTIAPKKEYWILTVSNLLIVGGLLTTEFLYPNFVVKGYNDRSEHFIDIGSTYLVSIVLMLVSLGYIINNYRSEKEKAENRAMLLDELHEEKARLISVISHDYQTPLISMKKYLEILSRYDLSVDERRMLESEISHSVVNTQNLLLNLLDITKGTSEPGKQMSAQRFNVQEALGETLNVYSDIAKAKGMVLEVTIPDDLVISSDPYLFSVVIRNFINNAVKFAGNNSTITFSYSETNNNHQFCVTDNGPGISETAKKAIIGSWESNFRSTSKSGGMGLVLAKRYAEAINGSLSFTSSPGSGANFYLKIPVEVISEAQYESVRTYSKS
jgi:signal transduction histidine kinase